VKRLRVRSIRHKQIFVPVSVPAADCELMTPVPAIQESILVRHAALKRAHTVSQHASTIALYRCGHGIQYRFSARDCEGCRSRQFLRFPDQQRKCLVLDLDNTIWGGVIGDRWCRNIQIRHLGQGKAFTELQSWARNSSAVIMLAICSKNERHCQGSL